jgi:hypothetical protein
LHAVVGGWSQITEAQGFGLQAAPLQPKAHAFSVPG